jgi:hypothetical protein
MFSATFAAEVRELAHTVLNPAMVEVARRNAPAELVTHTVIKVDQDRSATCCCICFAAHGWHQVLVFCRTKHGSDALAKKLEQSGVRTAALHGNKSQNARTRALADFKAGKLAALVATDIAARGLDIDSPAARGEFRTAQCAGRLHPPHRPHRPRRRQRRSVVAGQQRRAHSTARHRAPAEARDRNLGHARFRAAPGHKRQVEVHIVALVAVQTGVQTGVQASATTGHAHRAPAAGVMANPLSGRVKKQSASAAKKSALARRRFPENSPITV